MDREPVLAVLLAILILLAGCSVNITPGGGGSEAATESPTDVPANTATGTTSASPSSSTISESSTDEPTSEDSAATAAPTEQATKTDDEDSTETSSPSPSSDESPETTTEPPVEETETTTETDSETETTTESEGTTTEPTDSATQETADQSDSNQSNSNFSSELNPDTSPFPDRPETLNGGTVITYAIAYEKAYLQNAVANETSTGAEGGLLINDIAIKEAKILDQSSTGYNAQLSYVLNYTVVNEDGERRTERTQFTAKYFVNETETKRTAAAEKEQAADPETNERSSEALPEKPDTLTDESVLGYVAAYEEAHLRSAVLTEEGAGISEINEFSVQDAAILNETDDGYGVQLEYVLDYTAREEEGDSQDGQVLVTTEYIVNETTTKRADPSTTDIQAEQDEDANEPVAQSDSPTLADRLLDVAFKRACLSVLGSQLGPFAPVGCSVLDRWLFG